MLTLLPLDQVVASILFGAMFITRRRNYRVYISKSSWRNSYLEDDPDLACSSDELLSCGPNRYKSERIDSSVHPPKRRWCCGLRIKTPNLSRYAGYYHSRILQKFPFLIEMFYWIITYAFYRMTSITSQRVFSKTGIWDVAQDHGLAVLAAEQLSWLRFFFPLSEINIQRWFMDDHQVALTVLNKAYALIHIPGTVG